MNAHVDMPKPLFDVRSLNVTKIDLVVDCEIAISEADQSLRGIARQMADPTFNRDRTWLADTNAAKVDIEHKRSLLIIKRDALANSFSYQRDIDARNAGNKPSLRDQIAIAALTGICSNDYSLNSIVPLQCAEWAYQFADAMLAQRAKEADGTKPS